MPRHGHAADSTGLAFAQSLGTINGRVLDQGDAVLPGVTVTVTNRQHGVARTTVTNDGGRLLPAGLEPGVYNVDHGPGRALRPRRGKACTLGVNATLTLDFR